MEKIFGHETSTPRTKLVPYAYMMMRDKISEYWKRELLSKFVVVVRLQIIFYSIQVDG